MAVPRPTTLLDRTGEWEVLSRAWESAEPELLIVRGRRRAGKSYLLTRFLLMTGGVYYQATKRTEREQLTALGRAVGRHFGDPALERAAFEAWEDLFAYVAGRAEERPVALVLDEFPYLADAAPALPSILQAYWDHELAGTRLKLVLSGSHVSAMKGLTGADQPLYGRRTGLLQVDPLGYREAALFLGPYSARDRVTAYGIFGGLPGHLSLIDPTESVAENVARHLVDPSGRLHDEAVHAFDAFLPDAAVHYSIVQAIASGEAQWQKISRRIGKKSASLSRPLDWLVEMEVVERVAPITAYPDPSPKSTLYRLRDPYLAFWHRFMTDIRAQGIPSVLAPADVWRSYIEPRLNDYIGGQVFEEVCRQFVAHTGDARLPFRPARVGAWWSRDGQEEVALVAVGADGEVLVGECKWGQLRREDLVRLEERADRVVKELGRVRSVRLAVFVGGAVDRAVRDRIDSGEILLFTPDDLFDDLAPG